jgi:uncharacterized membrane protein YdjX (TVP38/TMEM64 family)
MRKKHKKYVAIFWGVLLIWFAIFLIKNPEYSDTRLLAEKIASYGYWGIGIYSVIFFFRWLILVPSTPLILIGLILFPDSPLAVFVISMTGILFSSAMIYGFSDMLGLDDYFASHVKSEKIKKWIAKYGFFAIMFWSFFLVLPTDLICYIAGAVRYRFWRFLLAVALWEWLIIGIFIFTGQDIFEYFLWFF